jgi:PRTRC genetic system ThiF family protein
LGAAAPAAAEGSVIPPLIPRYRIEIGEPQAVTVILAGCGGTGSFAALHLARLAYEARRGGGVPLQLVFVDPDTVEGKNIGRQNFAPCEIGLPKAVALASRYNLAFGLDIGAVVATFAEADPVRQQAGWRDWNAHPLLLVVGCVDSPAARREIEAGVKGARGVWWLDSGNGESGGQVLLGSGTRATIDPTLGCTALPWPSLQEPGIVADVLAPAASDGLSCAELMALNAQSLMINQAMAGWIGVYVYRLLLGRDLDVYQTWVDLKGGNVRSVAVTEGVNVVVQPARAEEPEITVTLPELAGGALGHCPNCGGLIFEGRDTIHEEIGEDDIVFCPACDWRQYLDEWQATVEEGGDAVMELLGFEEAVALQILRRK